MNYHLAELVACGRVNADGTTVLAAGFFTRGAVAALPGGAGTGIYTLTLPAGRGVPAVEAVLEVTTEAADVALSAVHTSELVKTVTSRTIGAAPAAVDSIFQYSLWRVSGGAGR
jgi:hypothetical protein